MYNTQLGIFSSIDPKAEEYFSWSPYSYCGNNPIKRIDVNGEGWREFLNGLASSMTAAITIGAQAGIEVKAAGKPQFSLYGNRGSKDLVGVRDGEFTHIAQEDSPTRYGHSASFGGFGTSTETEVVKSTEIGVLPPYPGTNSEVPYEVEVEKGTKTVSVGTILSVQTTETAEIRTNKKTGIRESSKTNPKVSTSTVIVKPDVSLKASFIIGIDLSIDLGKIWNAFKELDK